MKKLLLTVAFAILAFGAFLYMDREGHPEQPGQISGKTVPVDWTGALANSQGEAGAQLVLSMHVRASDGERSRDCVLWRVFGESNRFEWTASCPITSPVRSLWETDELFRRLASAGASSSEWAASVTPIPTAEAYFLAVEDAEIDARWRGGRDSAAWRVADTAYVIKSGGRERGTILALQIGDGPPATLLWYDLARFVQETPARR